MKKNLYPSTQKELPLYLRDYIQKNKLPYRTLDDTPVSIIREAQQELVFPEMRSIIVAPKIVNASLNNPLLKHVIVNRVGYCSHAKNHYIPRPDGCSDSIIIFCQRGKGWYRSRGYEKKVDANQALVIPPDLSHVYGAEQKNPWSLFWLHLNGTLIEPFFKRIRKSGVNPVVDILEPNLIFALVEKIYESLEKIHSEENLLTASGYCFQLLCGLSSQSMEKAMTPKGRERVLDSIQYMNEHLRENLTINQLAESTHLSVSRYLYLFKHFMKITPIAYFSRLRMQYASRLLIVENKTISEISNYLGFTDPYYFSKVFKKQMGMSPKYFRGNLSK